eukprot:4798262-Prymnesium_polylepis.1
MAASHVAYVLRQGAGPPTAATEAAASAHARDVLHKLSASWRVQHVDGLGAVTSRLPPSAGLRS